MRTTIGSSRTNAVVLGVVAVLALAACSTSNSGGRARGTARMTGGQPAAAPATPRKSGAASPTALPVVAPVGRVEVAPKPNPCASNTAPKLVRVSLRRQHLWLCARHVVAFGSPITSGMAGQYTETPTGDFHIQALNRNTTLTLFTGQQYQVKYWIPFDAPLFGFHDSSWQRFPYGSRQYRTDGSHGCVHVPLKAIAHLYRWAPVGTAVHIGR